MNVGIIGYGRFGRVLANILSKAFPVKVYDPAIGSSNHAIKITTLGEVLKQDTIFVAVPIRSFEGVIKDISGQLEGNKTVLDVCSVKIFPVKTMVENLPENVGIIATHPLFGPDSYLTNSNLKMVMHSERDIHNVFKFWKTFFKDQGINILEIEPEDHDRMAARTQGVTHFLGRMLKEYGIRKTNMDTQGFQDLIDLVNQTCNDTWELFTDLQNYNPYTKDMVVNIKNAMESLDVRMKGIK